MRTATIGVSSSEEADRRLQAAFRGEYQGEFISFVSPELLWNVLRGEALGDPPGDDGRRSHEHPRDRGGDVKAEQGDVQALLKAGVLDKTEEGAIVFSYDAIHVDFVLTKAA